jgi:hypothetical protein
MKEAQRAANDLEEKRRHDANANIIGHNRTQPERSDSVPGHLMQRASAVVALLGKWKSSMYMPV